MNADGGAQGTCFQVADGVLVTAWHVLDQIGAGAEGAENRVEPLAVRVGEGTFAATVTRVDPVHDLAVLVGGGLPAAVGRLAATDSVARNAAVVVTGVPYVDDPGHVYRDWDAPGTWAGGVTRDDLPWGQLSCNGVVPGMSGAPVLLEPDGTVVGVVSGRLNSGDGWARDRVWAARVEDLLPLLDGLADPVVADSFKRSGPVEAVLSVVDGAVSLSCRGVTVSEPVGQVPYALVDALERLGRDRASRTGLRRAGATAEPLLAPSGVLAEVGQLLSSTFLTGAVASRLAEVLGEVRAGHQVLRLGVRASGAWAALPWEAMGLLAGVPVGMDANVEVVRLASSAVPLPGSAGPLRVLVAISAPLEGGGGILDYERELRNIVAAVRGARAGGRAHVEVVPFATTGEIRQAIQARHEADLAPHVLHLSGHGGPGVFEFEDEHGRARALSVADFVAEAIPPGMMPPVWALAACHTDARTATGDPSFAAGLLERGASVVISTETAITDVYATRVFARVYQNLAAGHADVVTAVTQARQAVQRELSTSNDTGDQQMAGLGEWAVLRVNAAPGATRLVDPTLPPLQMSAVAQPGGVLRRGTGEVVGRRREQRQWPQQLLGDTVTGMVIHGLGGIGKTTLADELLHRIGEHAPHTIITTLKGALTGPELIEHLTRSAQRHFHESRTVRALEQALDQTATVAVRLEGLDRYLHAAGTVMVALLDNFEDNLTGTTSTDRTVAAPLLADTLAALTQSGGRIKLLITCRYRFTLPEDAQHTLVFHRLAPLSAAETAKLSWTLPQLNTLDQADLEMVWHSVGGHPRSLEYVDALLAGGHSRFPDIRRRLLATATARLTDTGHDPDTYFAAHTHLDAALAETITLTADDLLLTQLLDDLAPVTHAHEALYAAAVYRRPIDLNALMFQLGEPDQTLRDEDWQRRHIAREQLQALLADAGIAPGPVDALAPSLRRRAQPLVDQLNPRAPIAPVNLTAAIRACAASSLLTTYPDGSMLVHRATATALTRHHPLADHADRHLRAAAYWQWRVQVWPQPAAADINDLIEAHHHLDTAVGLGRPEALTHLAAAADRLQRLLGEAGRRSEALTYAQHTEYLCRQLTTANPDAFQPDLAAALNNLGVRLSEMGRREQALAVTDEAVTTHRQLATANPDAFLPNLAAALNNLGVRLSEMGRRERALAVTDEAVTAYRQLAKANPEAFLPDLAMALNNLGIRLSNLGRREQALTATEEAVAIRRQLAAANPEAFLPDLAGALNNLGADLSDLGRREQALAATEEAVAIRRQLAAANPDAFLPNLAGGLNNLGADLSDLGRHEQALTATEEAVTAYRQLAEANPDAFLPNLAMALNNLGIRLSNLGHRGQALTPAQEAVAVYRQLAAANPEAFLPDLANSLWNIGWIAADHGIPDQNAIATTREAVQLFHTLATQLPMAYEDKLLAAATTLATLLEQHGDHAEANDVRARYQITTAETQADGT